MKNITEELNEQGAVICMRCMSVYIPETEHEDVFNGTCDTCGNKTLINYVTGNAHLTFWGSTAAKNIAKEFNHGGQQ